MGRLSLRYNYPYVLSYSDIPLVLSLGGVPISSDTKIMYGHAVYHLLEMYSVYVYIDVTRK